MSFFDSSFAGRNTRVSGAYQGPSAGGRVGAANAVNTMINLGLEGVEFHRREHGRAGRFKQQRRADEAQHRRHRDQGSRPPARTRKRGRKAAVGGRAAESRKLISGADMVFVTAGHGAAGTGNRRGAGSSRADRGVEEGRAHRGRRHQAVHLRGAPGARAARKARARGAHRARGHASSPSRTRSSCSWAMTI